MKALRTTGKVLLIILIVIVVLVGGFLIYLSATEYSPKPVEELEILGSSTRRPVSSKRAASTPDSDASTSSPASTPSPDTSTPGPDAGDSSVDSDPISDDQSISIVSWNTGYGALGDNADFFMDGGTKVYTADEDRVNSNMNGISEILQTLDADIMLLQETDVNSSRSYGINEVAYLCDTFPDYESCFAYNFKTPIVPYPIPPIGRVGSGILTLSRFDIASASRIQLPCPFKWPISTVNLKRCLLTTRIPVEGSDKELVVINLHLEAYDDGEGKAAQQSA